MTAWSILHALRGNQLQIYPDDGYILESFFFSPLRMPKPGASWGMRFWWVLILGWIRGIGLHWLTCVLHSQAQGQTFAHMKSHHMCHITECNRTDSLFDLFVHHRLDLRFVLWPRAVLKGISVDRPGGQRAKLEDASDYEWGRILHILGADRLCLLAGDALRLLPFADDGHPGRGLHSLAAEQSLRATQSLLAEKEWWTHGKGPGCVWRILQGSL